MGTADFCSGPAEPTRPGHCAAAQTPLLREGAQGTLLPPAAPRAAESLHKTIAVNQKGGWC